MKKKKKKKRKITWQLSMILATLVGVVPLARALDKPPTQLDIPRASSAQTEPDAPSDAAISERAPPPPPAAPASVLEAPPAPPPQSPGQSIDLTNWKLTLPIDTAHAGSPDEIMQPELAGFSLEPFFWRMGEGAVFRAHAGGATTSNSGYPRSELREMAGPQRAGWSNAEGRHTMTIRQAITHLPQIKPHVVSGQIHDASDDVIMIRLERSRLFVESDGKEIGLLDPNYALGTVFTVTIEATGGHIRVLYNGTLMVDYAHSGTGYYFKAGCYTQSNTSKGDAPDAYGEVIIYGLHVDHS